MVRPLRVPEKSRHECRDGRQECLRHLGGALAVTRRSFLFTAVASAGAAPLEPGFRLVDVTAAAGLDFHHNSGAFGEKYLPETMGPGCAFFDYDGDGWLDILIVNGADWLGHKRQ